MASGFVRRKVTAWLLVALTFLLALQGCAGEPPVPQAPLAGTVLKGKVSPDFTLRGQGGAEVRLSGLRGKPVVLTFLYTSCPDICPVVTAKFAETSGRLGERRDEVAFVAVTVDPERDSVDAIGRFLTARGLGEAMVFLTGERKALEEVWKAYYIGVQWRPLHGGAYDVAHTDAIYLLDKRGRQRAFMRSTFGVEEILGNLEILLMEP